MYFKILPGTKAFNRIQKVRNCQIIARDMAIEIVKEVGAKTWLLPYDSIGGGIAAFQMDKCPDGWKRAGGSDIKNGYFPKASPQNKELLARIKALPTIKLSDYANALNYEPQSRGRELSLCPGIQFKNKFLLIDALVENYKPLPGMIEITESEYRKLSASK